MNKVCMKMVVNGNPVCCWIFSFIWRPFQPNLSVSFSFDILNIISFKLAVFVTTKEELLTLDQAALPKLTQMG